uniref:DUF4806 domain-containing protein n=1 Tax=Trichogramma kaykai TaxID=54128 RepID=A0ABD2WUN9_9HYME
MARWRNTTDDLDPTSSRPQISGIYAGDDSVLKISIILGTRKVSAAVDTAATRNFIHPDWLPSDTKFKRVNLVATLAAKHQTILGKIYFQNTNDYKPFPIAVYCGKGKPKSVEKYLHEFNEELEKLLENGLTIKNKHFEVRIMCFICDRPARAFIKCFKGHTGYYACERCEVPGTSTKEKGKRGSRITFPSVDDVLRSDESFRNHTNPQHHLQVSPLTKIKNIDMIRLPLHVILHTLKIGFVLILFEMAQYKDYNRVVNIEDEDFQEDPFIIAPPQYVINGDDKQLYVKYMKPPYSSDDLACIQNFIMDKHDPPEKTFEGAKQLKIKLTKQFKSSNSTLGSEVTNSGGLDQLLREIPSLPSGAVQENKSDDNQTFSDDALNNNNNNKTQKLNDIRKQTISSPEDCNLSAVTEELCSRLIKEMENSNKKICSYIEKKVLSRILIIEKDVEHLKQLIDTKKNNPDVLTFQKFVNMYPTFQFPINNKQEFDRFNAELHNNTKDIKTNLVKHIFTAINFNKDIIQNMTNIMRSILCREIIINHTAKRQMKDKKIFEGLSFHSALEDAYTQAYKGNGENISADVILKTIGSVITNANDWDGNRIKRMKLN